MCWPSQTCIMWKTWIFPTFWYHTWVINLIITRFMVKCVPRIPPFLIFWQSLAICANDGLCSWWSSCQLQVKSFTGCPSYKLTTTPKDIILVKQPFTGDEASNRLLLTLQVSSQENLIQKWTWQNLPNRPLSIEVMRWFWPSKRSHSHQNFLNSC